MFFQPLRQLVVNNIFHDRAHFGRYQLVLGLGREFGVRYLYRDHTGQAFTRIIARQSNLFLFRDPAFLGVTVDLAGQRGTETGHMRAAIALGNVVGKAQRGFVIAVIPLQRNLDGDAFTLAHNGDRFFDLTGFGAIKILHKRPNAAFVMQVGFGWFAAAFIPQCQKHTGIQKCQFPQAMLKGGQIKLGHSENFGIGIEGNFRPGQRFTVFHDRRIANHFKRFNSIPARKFHVMFLAIAPDAQFQQG